MNTKGVGKAFLLGIALVLSLALSAQAAEVTLKAVSAFAVGTLFSKDFERMIDKINAEGKGLVKINYLGGGGKVMNPFELGNAVRTGVVDVGNLPGAFYTNLMPEADAIKLIEHTNVEFRKNGGWNLLNKIHNEKINAYYLASNKNGVPFHLYLNKNISKPDLAGLKIRVTPIYRAFFTKLGAVAMRTKPGDVFTALERGAVDGYGWPIQGILDLGWHEVTKYRVEPGFYNSSVAMLVNLDKWRSLSSSQQNFLNSMATWQEGLEGDQAGINQTEAQRQAKAGIKTIKFSSSVSREYLRTAYQEGWASVMKASPKYGPEMKRLFSK